MSVSLFPICDCVCVCVCVYSALKHAADWNSPGRRKRDFAYDDEYTDSEAK